MDRCVNAKARSERELVNVNLLEKDVCLVLLPGCLQAGKAERGNSLRIQLEDRMVRLHE